MHCITLHKPREIIMRYCSLAISQLRVMTFLNPFEWGQWSILYKLGQYHTCWCHGNLHCHVGCSHGMEWAATYLTWGLFSDQCQGNIHNANVSIFSSKWFSAQRVNHTQGSWSKALGPHQVHFWGPQVNFGGNKSQFLPFFWQGGVNLALR